MKTIVEADGELHLTDFYHRGQGEIFAGVKPPPASLHESGRAILILADDTADFRQVGSGVLPGGLQVGGSQIGIGSEDVGV